MEGVQRESKQCPRSKVKARSIISSSRFSPDEEKHDKNVVVGGPGPLLVRLAGRGPDGDVLRTARKTVIWNCADCKNDKE